MATITGTAGNDRLQGTADWDEIFGLGGNDILIGAGVDNLYGGLGNDSYHVVDFVSVTEAFGEGANTVYSSLGAYPIPENVEALVMTEAAGAASGTGNGVANLVYGNRFNNVIDGGAGADTMAGGRGNDTYRVDNAGDKVIELGGEGRDTVESTVTYTLAANVENLTLLGSDAINGTGNTLDNVLIGNGANNTLTGGAGNDFLDGRGGADRMVGGTGDDTYVVDRGTPLNAVTSLSLRGEPGAWVFQGSQVFTTAQGSFIPYAFDFSGDGIVDHVRLDYLDSSNSFDLSIGAPAGSNIAPGVYADARRFGSSGPQLDFNGNSMGNNQVFGNFTVSEAVFDYSSGSPTLVEFSVTFEQHGESPAAPGVFGTFNYNHATQFAPDVVVELPNQGTDTVQSAIDYVLGANVENLVLTGNTATKATGNGLDNAITGNALNNAIDGGAGADTMAGGLGNDTYVVDNRKDVVNENAGEGTDLVRSSVTFSLSANVENLTLTGAAAIDGTGNALANVILGNAAKNNLYGGDGHDTLYGGAGADRLEGGRGSDTYFVDNGGDTVKEKPNEGIDHVFSTVTFTLENDVENLTLLGSAAIDGTGNKLNNVIMGNAAANRLTGGDGNDTLHGGGGADTLFGGKGDNIYYLDDAGDAASETGGGGIDTIISTLTHTLGADFENLTLGGAAAIDGTGNAKNNILIGNGAANTLSGGTGDDVLDGDFGPDALIGGAGNDTYIVNETDDAAIEAAGQGTDLVKSSATYMLAANLENLTLTGEDAIDGIGNSLANAITGNRAANLLDGRGGADRLAGGLGDDVYVVDNAGDVVTEGLDQGIDRVESSITYTLTANVENLLLTGSVAINGTGNALNNILEGNAAANVLRGGAGNDIYVVNALDTVIENAAAGNDTVISSVSYTLGANLENLALIGAAVNGTGNDADNTIIGNSGANTLIGGKGNDVLDGHGGVDTLKGGAGDDTYIVDSANLANAGTRVALQGYGDPFFVSSASGTFFVELRDSNGDGLADALRLAYADDPAAGINWVSLDMTTFGVGRNLEPGDYPGAVRAPFSGPGQPGLDLSVSTLGFIDVLGSFTIRESAFDYAGATPLLLRFAADFEITSAPTTLTGTFEYHSSGGSVVTEPVIELANEGTDTVRSTVDYVLGANLENLVLIGIGPLSGTGNALANTITGGNGDNWIDGRAGVDTLRGGLGNDNYVVDNAGDKVIESPDEGFDRVLSSVSYTLGENVENLILTGASAVSGTGNALDNGLTGNGAANVLRGGAGNDTYVVDALDTVVENANEGIDTVKTYSSFTLGNNLENLTLLGTLSVNGTGNDLQNTLIGNNGNNTLDGRGGVDAMYGFGGDDVFVVDDQTDTVVEDFARGTDLVRSSAEYYYLGQNIENLTLTGTGNIAGIGNLGDNVITGNAGNNLLDGSQGIDTLIGGKGDNIYYVDGILGAPVGLMSLHGQPGSVVFQGEGLGTLATGDFQVNAYDSTGEGLVDTVRVAFFPRVEGTGIFAYAEVTLSARQLSPVITPGSYSDAQEFPSEGPGHPGISFTAGGAYYGPPLGSFTVNSAEFDYSFGSPLVLNFSADFEARVNFEDPANAVTGTVSWSSQLVTDTVVEQANEGIDTVRSSVSYTLGANLENLQLVGFSSVNGTGNAGNNIIEGNGGSNRLTGGGGSDTFDYNVLGTPDVIADFATGAGGDKLDVKDLLIGFMAGSSNVADFVRLSGDATHTDVAIDYDGTGGDFIMLGTLENVAFGAGLLNQMLAQGNLVVA